MIKTIFADGTVDIYKGKRAVTAGWMITLPSGKILMGHSLDVVRAAKTAATKSADASHLREAYPAGRFGLTGNYIAYRERYARKYGFKNYDAYAADIKLRRAAFVESCTIEIVEVSA